MSHAGVPPACGRRGILLRPLTEACVTLRLFALFAPLV
jgi:hypothetical protein